MSNDVPPASTAPIPPEPYDEPWRIDAAQAGRRRRFSRRSVIPAAIGVLATIVLGVAVAFGDSPRRAPTAPRPTETPAPRTSPEPAARPAVPPSPTERAPRSSRATPDGDRSHATTKERAGSADRPSGDRRPRTSRQHGAETKQGGRAPRDHRPRVRKPRKNTSWIDAECRRRYKNDATRRAACVAALRGYLGN